jgi:hypothetical protein
MGKDKKDYIEEYMQYTKEMLADILAERSLELDRSIARAKELDK